MGDYLFDWNESSMNIDISNHGIPIPRSQHSPYLRPDFGNQGYLYDNESPSPSRPPLVPPNSLVMNFPNSSPQFIYPSENQRVTLSPFNSSGSPFMLSNNIDDIEIKMEPLEELLEISGMVHQNSEPSQLPEDNLLDNVNFEDLLMTDDMDSSTTTCLDPQHSSPAAMATVHPDEVLGLMRSDNYTSPHISQSFSPSINVPVKSENLSLCGLATSFPPQGIGWKDQIQNHSPQNQSFYQTTDNQQSQQNNLIKETLLENQPNSSRILVLQSELSSSHNIQQQMDESDISRYINNNNNNKNKNNNQTYYTPLEPSSNSTNSALHDLLVNSSPIPHSPQVQQQQPQQLQQQQQQQLQQLSPANGNLSPVSPIRGYSAQEIPVGQSVPGAPSFLAATSSNLSSRLSSSAPVNNFSLENIWQRREPRQHLLSTGSLAEEVGGSTSSLSTGGGILSPIPHDLSIDEGIDSDDDSDGEHYDSDSDNDSIMSEEMSLLGQSGKKERHFWQYNVQAKGPKGHRVNITQNETDPHQLDKIMDPVFSPLCSIQGIKHSGKARRGDGNDLTPSPRKLVTIGVELNKLNKKINEMTPVSELPSTVRSKSRKEKNKLASRACRLKKKAQHEANKIKLYGLEQEHKGMMALINKAKEELVRKMDLAEHSQRQSSSSSSSSPPKDYFGEVGSPNGSSQGGESTTSSSSDPHSHLQQTLTNHIEKAAKMRTKQRIAGFTTEFVNKVIENCRTGNPTGGLDELAQTFVKSSSSTSESGGLNYNNELYT